MAVNVKINGVTYRATDDYSIKQQGGAISTTQLRVLLGLNPVPSILQQVQIYMDATLFFTGLVQKVGTPEYSTAYETNIFSLDVSSLECLFNFRLVTKNFYDYTYTSWTQVIQYLFTNYIAEENVTLGEISTIPTTFDSKYSVKDKKLSDVLNEIADIIGTASWWIDPETRQFYFRVADDFDVATPPTHVREFKLTEEIGDIRTEESITGASAGVTGAASNAMLRTTLAARTGGSGKIEYAETDKDIHSDAKANAEAGYRLNLHDESQKTITCVCEDLTASKVYTSWPLDITINGIAISGDFIITERTIAARGPDIFSISVTLRNNNYFARYGYALKRTATIANESIAALSDIAADSKLTPGEKITELARWNAELATKAAYDAEADAYGVSRVAYDAAFVSLSTYLNGGGAWTSGAPVWFDGEAFTETTDIVGTDYDDNWQVYWDARRSLEIATRLAIQAAADDAIAAAHKVAIRLRSSDSRILRSRSGIMAPTSVALNAWYSDTGAAYSGRLQIELTVNGTDFVVAYQSASDESSHAYTVPATYESAYVVNLRCRLYAAGAFTELLQELNVSVNADPNAAPIYWGALATAPTVGIQTDDYYFDNRAVASGGGKLLYYTGSSWVEMTSAHSLYAHAMKTAITDIMIWATAQGETVVAANAVVNSIVASEAFIDQLSTSVLNAAIAIINEYLTIGTNGYVAGADAETGQAAGDMRTYLSPLGVYNQVFDAVADAWKNNISMRNIGEAADRRYELVFGRDEASKISYDPLNEIARLENLSQPILYNGTYTYSEALGTDTLTAQPISLTFDAIQLSDTQVLLVYSPYGGGGNTSLASVIFNPTTFAFGAPATFFTAAYAWPGDVYLTKLLDGNVLCLIGYQAFLYNVTTATWGSSMAIPCLEHSPIDYRIIDAELQPDGNISIFLRNFNIDGVYFNLYHAVITPSLELIGEFESVLQEPSSGFYFDEQCSHIIKANGDITFYFSSKSGSYYHLYCKNRVSGVWDAAVTDLLTSTSTSAELNPCANTLPNGNYTISFAQKNGSAAERIFRVLRYANGTMGTPAEVATAEPHGRVSKNIQLFSGKNLYMWTNYTSPEATPKLRLRADSSALSPNRIPLNSRTYVPMNDWELTEDAAGSMVLHTPFGGYEIASPSVRVYCNKSTVLNVSAGLTVKVMMDGVIEDTHNAVSNPSTDWLFTCPEAGVYLVEGFFRLTGAFAGFGDQTFRVVHNASVSYYLDIKNQQPTNNVDLIGQTTIRLAKNDTLYFLWGNGDTNAHGLQTNISRISITEIQRVQ